MFILLALMLGTLVVAIRGRDRPEPRPRVVFLLAASAVVAGSYYSLSFI